ncbi:hypothetical protein CN184_25080 [Sinorhizobium medicae]|uniref:hypothetical protein n=1 Tax=Sinorhizobium medicae TaxID=110321 RepID=UPI000FD49D05|nr:hypothetical protein [Sinorhizobium medicae]MQX45940.1 hypothetical protein [Sinorhizobium medicae]RVJ17809.1 hypothetical protein CN184_25080 [Sinorhizobium medicae]
MKTYFVATGLLLSGCTVHPLPEGVAHLDTRQIVNQIRCEARESIITAIGLYLTTFSDKVTYQAGKNLLDKDIQISELKFDTLHDDAQFNIKKYIPAAIAYDFTFDMSEGGEFSADAGLLNTFTRGVVNVNFGAGSQRQRQTIRNFSLSDTFGDLLGYEVASLCGRDNSTQRANYNYPISGKIGLDEVVRTFVDLNEYHHLKNKEKDAVPVMSDTFHFQTTIGGSVAPKVTLSPVGSGTHLSEAGLRLAGSRTDIHTVIVALSLAPSTTEQILRREVDFLGAPPSREFGRTPAEVNALDAIDTQVQRQIITNLSGRVQ